MSMQVHDKNEILVTPSDQHGKNVTSWEGKDVSKETVDVESSKKSKSIFSKMKGYMKSAWNHKYKILLAALGVVAAGATVTGLSMLVAKKVNRKALPEIKPDAESKKDSKVEETLDSKEVSEVEETADKETTTPQLVHLTLGRPVREGIRSPTKRRPYENLLKGNEVVADKEAEKEVVDSKDEEKGSPELVHLTLDRPTRDGIRLPTSHKPYEKLFEKQDKVSDEPVVEIPVQQEQAEKHDAIVQQESEPEHSKDVQDQISKESADVEKSVVEEEAKQSDVDTSVDESDVKTVDVASKPVKEQEIAPVKTPEKPTVSRVRTRRQAKHEQKLSKKLDKYEKKKRLHPRKSAKYNRKISKVLNRIAAVK